MFGGLLQVPMSTAQVRRRARKMKRCKAMELREFCVGVIPIMRNNKISFNIMLRWTRTPYLQSLMDFVSP